MIKKVPPIKELRKTLQTHDNPKDWHTRIFMRTLSIYVTKVLLCTPVTANQVTLFMLMVGIAAAVLFTFGNYWYSLIGALLFQSMYVLDGVDGEIARYKGTTSACGHYLDRLYHNITYPFIFVGISFGAYSNSHDVKIFIFGFLASLFILVLFLDSSEVLKMLREAGRDKGGNQMTAASTKQKSRGKIFSLLNWVSNKALGPGSPPIIMNIVLIGAIFDYLHIVLIFYGIYLPCRFSIQVFFNLKSRLHGL